MKSSALVINIFVLCCLAVSFWKSKEKTKKALKVAGRSFVSIFPMVVIIILIIGLLLGFIPPAAISGFIGRQSGWEGFLSIALIGSTVNIPSLLSFPLAASLLDNGATIASVAVFITTLTMIGMVTLPLEIKLLGKKFTFLRNGISFVIAVIIALLMGIIL